MKQHSRYKSLTMDKYKLLYCEIRRQQFSPSYPLNLTLFCSGQIATDQGAFLKFPLFDREDVEAHVFKSETRDNQTWSTRFNRNMSITFTYLHHLIVAAIPLPGEEILANAIGGVELAI